MTRLWFTILVAGSSGGCSGGNDSGSKDDDTGATPIVDPFDYQSIRLTVQLTDQEVDGGRVTYWMPEHPRAVLFAFHGTNGSIATVTQTEWLALYDLLVPYDVGLVMTNSQNRDTQQWDDDDPDPSTNPDR
jgi:hypothetical protein